jgi:hypothetical protein
MLEINPGGFKYIVSCRSQPPPGPSHTLCLTTQVTTTFSENLGQAGRADMSCHWEDTDSAVQEMYSNVSDEKNQSMEQVEQWTTGYGIYCPGGRRPTSAADWFRADKMFLASLLCQI